MNKKILYAVVIVAIVLVLFGLLHSCSSAKKQPATVANKNTAAAEASAMAAITPATEKIDFTPVAANGASDAVLIKSLSDKIAKNYNDGASFYQRALVYADMQQYEMAITDYTEALRIAPDSANAYYNRALMYMQRNNFTNAVKDFTAAIKLRPKDARNYNGRGLAYVELNSQDFALNDYNKALTLDPKYTAAYYNRATLYERENNLKAAKDDYSKAIDLFKETEKNVPSAAALEVYYRRAIVNVNTGDLADAMTDITYVITQDPKMVKAYKLRAAIYTKQGNSAAAAIDESTADNLGMAQMLKQ